MATEIEQRVVEMKFDNHAFEKNVNQSLSTIQKLKMALNFDGVKGLDQLTKAANKVDLSNVSNGVEQISLKFKALDVVGFTVIQNLTNTFLGLGRKLWNISFGQMVSGGMSRALKIEQANFKMRALAKNIDGVGNSAERAEAFIAAMGTEIDKAVTGTAYGYDAAANVASQLMASGVTSTEKMYTYLRGIAGAAAMTGRSYEDIGNIFTTVASNGKLMTMQLRQFSSSGLNVAATLAQQWGKTEAEVADMVSKGQVQFEEFATAMYDAFGEAAGEADKTYSGVMSNVKAQLSRIGQLFAEPYIENMIPVLQKLKAAIKNLNTAIKPTAKRFEDFMKSVSNWASNFLEGLDFSKLDYIFRGLENLFWSVALVLRAIGQAFAEVFPKPAIHEVMHAAAEFEFFTESLVPTEDALEGIKTLVVLLLQPLKLVTKFVSAVWKVTKPIISKIFQLTYNILAFSSSLREIVNVIKEVVADSNIIDTVLTIIGGTVVFLIDVVSTLVGVIGIAFMTLMKSSTIQRVGELLKSITQFIERNLIRAIGLVISVISKLFSLVDFSAISTVVNWIINSLDFLFNFIVFGVNSVIDAFIVLFNSDNALELIKDKVVEIFNAIREFFGFTVPEKAKGLSSFVEDLKNKLMDLGAALSEFISGLDAKQLIVFAFAGAIIVLVLNISKMVASVTDLVYSVTNITNSFSMLTSTIKSIKKTAASAKTFMYFGAAIMLTAGALYELSKVPPDQLKTTAIILGIFTAALLGTTIALSLIFSKFKYGAMQIASINAIGKTLVAFSVAMMAIAVSLKIISSIDRSMDELLQLVVVLAAVMAAFAISAVIISKFSKSMSVGALSILAFAAAVAIVIKVLKSMEGLDPEKTTENLKTLMKAMVTLGLSIGLLSIFNASGVGAAFTILAFVLALKLVIMQLKALTEADIESIEKSIQPLMSIMTTLGLVVLAIGIADRVSQDVKFASIWKIIVSLGAFLLAVAMAMKIVSDIPTKKLEKAKESLIEILDTLGAFLIIFTVIIAVFAALMKLIQWLSKGEFTGDFTVKVAGFAAMIIAFGVSLLAAAAALKVIASIPDENFAEARKTMIEFFIAFGIIFAFLEGLSYFTKDAKATPIIAALSTIALLVGAMVILSMIPSEELLASSSAISMVLIALAAVMLALGKVTTVGNKELTRARPDAVKKQTKLVLVTAGLIGAVTAVMFALSKINWVRLKENTKSMAIITGLLVAMGVFVVVADKLKVNGSNLMKLAGGMAILSLCFIAIGAAMSLVPDEDFGQKMLAILLLFVVLGALFGVLVILSDDANKALGIGGAIALATLSLVEIAYAINKVPKMSNDLKQRCIALGGLFAEILVLFGLLMIGKWDWSKVLAVGASLVLATGSLILIAEAISLLPDDIEGLTEKCIALGILVGELAFLLIAIVFITEKKEVDPLKLIAISAAIVVLSTSLLVIGRALNLLSSSGASAGEMILFAGAFAILIAALSVAAAILGTFEPAVKGLLAFAAVIAAFAALISSFYLITEGIKNLADTLEYLCSDAIDIEQFSENLHGLVNTVGDAALWIAAQAPKFLVAALAIVGVIALAISMAGMILAAKIPAQVAVVAAALVVALPTILDAFSAIIHGIYEWVHGDGHQTIYELGYSIGTVIEEGALGAADGFGEHWAQRVTGIGDEIAAEQERLAQVTNEAMLKWFDYNELDEAAGELSQNVIDGLRQGIINGAWSVEEVVAELGRRGLEAYEDEMEINSPSLKMIREGNYTWQGIYEGIQEGEYTMFEVMQALAEGMVDNFKDGIDSGDMGGYLMRAIQGGMSQEEYNRLKEEANQNLGGQARWQRYGYDNAEDYIYAHRTSDTTGHSRWNSEEVDEVTDHLDDYSSILADATAGLGDFGSASSSAATATNELRSSLEDALDIFTEFNDEATLSGQDVLETFMGQLYGVNKWAKELETLTKRGLNAGILKQLEGLGPSGYEKIHAFTTMSDEELTLINQMYSTKLVLEDKATADILASFRDAGVMSAAEFQEAIKEGSVNINAQFEQTALDAIASFKKKMTYKDVLDAVGDFQDAIKSTVASSLSLFDEVSEQEEISAEQMIKNMHDQIKRIGRWATNLKTLAGRGLSEGLLAELQALGPEGAAKVEAFVKMSDAQLAKANSLYASSLELPDYVANKLTKSYADAGFDAILGFTDAMDPTAAQEVMVALGNNTLEALKETLGIHSPSTKMAEIAQFGLAGLFGENGFNDQYTIKAGVASFGEVLLSDFRDEMNNVYKCMRDSFKELEAKVIADELGTIHLTPVLDMDKLNDQLARGYSFDISGSIAAANRTNSNARTDRNDLADAIKQFTGTKDILNAIDDIRDDIRTLNRTMGNTQIVLDSGVVAGQVNRTLGKQYSMDRRIRA